MESMIKAMLKNMGFNPETIKAQIENAGKEYIQIKEQLNRIETAINNLGAAKTTVPLLFDESEKSDLRQ